MKDQSSQKKQGSSPALRLAQVFLAAVLGLGAFWWTLQIQPLNAHNVDAATVTAEIACVPVDLVLTKSDNGVTVEPGDILTYTLAYTNVSSQKAYDVVIADTVPEHTTFYTPTSTPGWTCVHGAPAGTRCTYQAGYLMAGKSGRITFAVRIVEPLPARVTAIENTASISDDGRSGPDPTPWNNKQTITTPVVAAPNLEISKHNYRTVVQPGETLAYLITITNTGNQDAAGILVTDTLPNNTTFMVASDYGEALEPGIVAWPEFDLAGSGGHTTRLVVVTVDNPVPAGLDTITNTVSAIAPGQTELVEAHDIDIVDAAPDLTLTKHDGDVVTHPGATLVYTLTYANVGNQDATGVVITETLPAHTAFNQGASATGWTCIDGEPGGTRCTYALGHLHASASGHVTFAVSITNPLPAGVTHIDNIAVIADDGSNGEDPTPQNNTATTTTPVSAAPDLQVSKSNGVDTVEPGDTLVYQIIVTNSGDQGATGIRLTDYLPAHTLFVSASDGGSQVTSPIAFDNVVSWPEFSLAGGGASVTRVLTVSVADPFPVDTNVITNTVTVTDDGANGPDPTPENNTAVDVDTVAAASVLLMSKDNGVDTVVPGQTLIYQLVITNTGNQIAADIRITDTLPANTTFYIASNDGSESAPGIVTWPPFSLSGGDSTTRLLVVILDDPLPGSVTALTNTAVLRDNRGNTAIAIDSDAVNANPLLTLNKTSAVDAITPGETFAYTLTLTNHGNQEATGIRITDTLPADVIFAAASDGGGETEPGSGIVVWPAFNLAGGGASVTRLLTVTVNPALPAGLELLVNTARAVDDRGNTATAHHAAMIIAAPDLAIDKTDGGVAPRPGDVLLYTLTYANVGNQGATGVFITETVPAHTRFHAAASSPGWTCADEAPARTICTYVVGDLPAITSGVVTFAAHVVNPLPAYVRQTTNAAFITDDGSNGADPDPTNNTASITTPFDATIDLLITKDDGGITAEPGKTLVYTLTYANIGDQIAGGVIITETVPAGTTFNRTASSPGWTCVQGAPAGTVCIYPLGDVIEEGVLFFAVDVVLPFPLDVTEIINQVIIGADAGNIPDANPDNNTDTTVTPVITGPDLVAGKDDGFSVVLPEQSLTYVITVTNVGTQNATNVQILDTLPDHVTFIGASDGGTLTAPGIVTWPLIAQLARSEIVTRTLDVVVDSALPASVSHITNTVVVSDDGAHGPDLNPDDNIATDVNIVGAMPDLVLNKTVNRTAIHPRGSLIYTIRVRNIGSQGATGVSIIDHLPLETQFVGASDGGYESEPGIVTWPDFALNVGQLVTRTLTVQVAPDLPEGRVITNTATVSDDGENGIDPTPENNTDTAISIVKWPVVYLPLVMRNYSVGPDLIVENIVVADGAIAITIKNQGKLPVPAPLGFWVDLYINPSPAPTRVNQTWDSLSAYGAAWGVDREALPILPNETRVLYLYDRYYKSEFSRLPAALRAGDVIYVQVDSYNADTDYGAVLEDHEIVGLEYNNILRMVIDAYQPLDPPIRKHNLPESPETYILPERP